MEYGLLSDYSLVFMLSLKAIGALPQTPRSPRGRGHGRKDSHDP